MFFRFDVHVGLLETNVLSFLRFIYLFYFLTWLDVHVYMHTRHKYVHVQLQHLNEPYDTLVHAFSMSFLFHNVTHSHSRQQ